MTKNTRLKYLIFNLGCPSDENRKKKNNFLVLYDYPKTMTEAESIFKRKKDFEVCYNKFFNSFYHIALQFISHEEDAEEVVQEAFIKLWGKDIDFQSEQEVKNYLFILIRNRCLNLLRDKKKQIQYGPVHDTLMALINYKLLDETGEDILLYSELVEKVRDAISLLTPQCRKVFELSRFEDLSNNEIADQMGISTKAVEANMTRAIKKLRDQLIPYLSGYPGSKDNNSLFSILLSLL